MIHHIMLSAKEVFNTEKNTLEQLLQTKRSELSQGAATMNELFFFYPFMYGFFPNIGHCIGWRGSSISQFCTLGSLFHSYKQQYVMLDLFEWGTERLGLLSMSLYIAYFQSIEYFLSATSSISYIVCFLSIHLDLQLNSKVQSSVQCWYFYKFYGRTAVIYMLLARSNARTEVVSP